MPEPRSLAQARVDRLIAQADALDERAVLEALRLLDRLRRELIAELAGQMSAYQRGTVEQTVAAMERLIGEFRRRYAEEIAALQARAFDLGTAMVDLPLAAASSRYFAPYVDRSLLEVAQGYSADLIRGLSAELRAHVSGEVRRGVLAGRPPFEVMQRIGSAIDKGVFASAAQRAEVITRTEVNRVLSIATDVRLTQAARQVPALKRQWLATLDDRTREAHRRAHEQVREIGEPFEVDGEPLRFPGDPAGAPGNTINCRCRTVPYSATWDDVVTPFVGGRIVPDWVRERLTAADLTEEVMSSAT